MNIDYNTDDNGFVQPNKDSLTCARCNYTWSPRLSDPSKIKCCPGCMSRKWNVKKEEVTL